MVVVGGARGNLMVILRCVLLDRGLVWGLLRFRWGRRQGQGSVQQPETETAEETGNTGRGQRKGTELAKRNSPTDAEDASQGAVTNELRLSSLIFAYNKELSKLSWRLTMTMVA